MIEYLTAMGPWTWVILALLLFVLETLIPGVHFLWFGLSALVVAAIIFALFAIAPDVAVNFAWQYQLIVFAAISVATVFLVRRFVSRPGDSDTPNLNIRGQQYVGRVVKVAQPITGGRGKVRIGDTLWQAEGADAPEGASVRVTGVNGTVMVVAPVE